MKILRQAVFALAVLAAGAAAAQPAPLQRFADQSAFDAYRAEVTRFAEVRYREYENEIILYHPPAPPPRSLTDVTPNVDGGDIAKIVDRFLIVLWDGALISVDLRPNGLAGLKRAASIELDPERFNEHAEIITNGNQVVVFANSAAGAEFLVFEVGDDGALQLEADFRIAQEDIYAYAHFAGGRLVIVSEMRVQRLQGDFDWPELQQDGDSQQMFNAGDVYRPALLGFDVALQAVSLCELEVNGRVSCTTTAAVGQQDRTEFISSDAAYFWYVEPRYHYLSRPARCDREEARSGTPAALLRIPFDGRSPDWVAVRGRSWGLWDEGDGSLRSLVSWCDSEQRQRDIRYFQTTAAGLGSRPPVSDYFRLPSRAADDFNLVVGDYLISAPGRDRAQGVRELRGARTASVMFTPLRQGEATTVRLPHDISRIEIVGNNLIFSGYRSGRGISLSRVRLGPTSQRTATITIEGRYQAMGRDDRAYSSVVAADGSGFLALPTWRGETYGQREGDVTFVALAPDGGMSELGTLVGRDPKPNEWWTPNARPYFFDGRLFALSGADVIEGAIEAGRLREVRRLDVSASH